jgi:hypothetical protein
VLVPFFDMINHANASDDDEEQTALYFVDPKSQTFKLVAARGYKQGEEIFINYGVKSAQQAMLSYGFCVACDEMFLAVSPKGEKFFSYFANSHVELSAANTTGIGEVRVRV